MTAHQLDRLLTVEEAAVLLSVSPKTVRNWVYKGQIPYIKISRIVRFKRSELDRWIEEGARLPNS